MLNRQNIVYSSTTVATTYKCQYPDILQLASITDSLILRLVVTCNIPSIILSKFVRLHLLFKKAVKTKHCKSWLETGLMQDPTNMATKIKKLNMSKETQRELNIQIFNIKNLTLILSNYLRKLRLTSISKSI